MSLDKGWNYGNSFMENINFVYTLDRVINRLWGRNLKIFMWIHHFALSTSLPMCKPSLIKYFKRN